MTTNYCLAILQKSRQGEVEREYHVDLVKNVHRTIIKYYLIGNLEKAEVYEEEGSKGRIKVIVLGETGLEMFLQLVVRLLHLTNSKDRT